MKLNPNNDVYPGDLSILNVRKQQWAKGEERSKVYNIGAVVILIAGLICMIIVNSKFGGTTMMSQLPLHITIWITALLAFLFSRKGKQISQAPFFGFHDARFETDDDTLYYRYQQGMTLRTFIIKDNNIHKITRDDEWGVILIEGDGVVNIERRGGETEEKVSEFYCLVPFDKYDLDDLLQPYGKKVKNAKISLRQKYIDEHQ
ncbi:MAG: hypothetical protein IJJ31_03405 [Mogibacterium sp.]|nr:hypothetical protein [Mogibacterium sp.]